MIKIIVKFLRICRRPAFAPKGRHPHHANIPRLGKGQNIAYAHRMPGLTTFLPVDPHMAAFNHVNRQIARSEKPRRPKPFVQPQLGLDIGLWLGAWPRQSDLVLQRQQRGKRVVGINWLFRPWRAGFEGLRLIVAVITLGPIGGFVALVTFAWLVTLGLVAA